MYQFTNYRIKIHKDPDGTFANRLVVNYECKKEGEEYCNSEDTANYTLEFLVISLKVSVEDLKGIEFTCTGVWETFTSSECMDFEIEYKNEKMSVKASDWYVEIDPEYYETYEDFVKECGNILTEEEFHEFQREERYLYEIENDDFSVGEVVVKPKLHEADWFNVPIPKMNT